MRVTARGDEFYCPVIAGAESKNADRERTIEILKEATSSFVGRATRNAGDVRVDCRVSSSVRGRSEL